MNRTLDRLYRRITWRERALPDFIIAGAMKSGTSSLFNQMAQHPRIFPTSKKEVHFFDGGLSPSVDTYRRGEAWYRTHFPLRKEMGAGAKAFEASPLYMFNPLAAARIAALLPEVRIIMALRNPTDRAISHYFHEKRKGREPLPIEEALRSEEKRLEPALAAQDFKDHSFIHHSYKARGMYYAQVERFLNVLPRERVLILNSSDVFADPEGTLRRIFGFVGVDPGMEVRNLGPSNVATNKTAVEAGVHEYLDAHFSGENRRLYELIGEDFGW